MKGVSIIVAYVEWHTEVAGVGVLSKSPVSMERIKVLREGVGYEYTPSNHNNAIKFGCCRKYYLELVFEGDFRQKFPGSDVDTIRVTYPDHTTDTFYNCELKQVQKKGRISYLLVEAD